MSFAFLQSFTTMLNSISCSQFLSFITKRGPDRGSEQGKDCGQYSFSCDVTSNSHSLTGFFSSAISRVSLLPCLYFRVFQPLLCHILHVSTIEQQITYTGRREISKLPFLLLLWYQNRQFIPYSP